MKKIILVVSIILTAFLFDRCNSFDSKAAAGNISFYDVPLVCGAAPEIGCGSRIKPLFMDTEREKSIKESWTNRQGTVIAIVWNANENEKLMQSLFEKNDIEAKLIFDSAEVKKISVDFGEKGKWLKGMEVDQLSIEEAGVIAESLTRFAEDEKLITHEECEKICMELEEYFKRELVIVRTEDELRSAEVQERWMRDGYEIYKKHIGKERADAVSEFYAERHGAFIEEDSCCDKYEKDDCCKTKKKVSLQSEITCPKCGHKKTETVPTDICLLKYTCENCHSVLLPKDDDCCVFCSYGTHKCPSMQNV